MYQYKYLRITNNTSHRTFSWPAVNHIQMAIIARGRQYARLHQYIRLKLKQNLGW